MPTKKQRRRRQKGRRHEYEYVWVDEEGHEVEVDVDETTGTAENGSRRPEKRGAAPSQRSVQPPSWRRVLRRGLIFAPLMYLFIALTSRDASTAAHVLFTVQLLVIFLPFSYVMDVLMYRMMRKREAKAAAQRR